MPRFPKRLLALGGLAAGGLAMVRKRRAGRPTPPSPSAPAFTPPPASTAPTEPVVTPPTPDAPAPPVKADSGTPQGRRGGFDDDALVEEEERLAAAEAAGIGGPGTDDAHGDLAFEAVYEGGGGEAEGFELSEEQLIENASHGGGRGDPVGDAFPPERESDEVTAINGEADEERVSEGDRDVTDR